MKKYRIFIQKGDEIIDNHIWHSESINQLALDFKGKNCAIMPIDQVPENWEEMSIENGKLIPAHEEVIQKRRVEALRIENEMIRKDRAMIYQRELDAKFFEAFESTVRNNPDLYSEMQEWLQDKDAIRKQHPYKED